MRTVTPEQRVVLKHTRGRKPVDLVIDERYPQNRDAVWAAIRKLRKFTMATLEKTTRIPQGTIHTYLLGLVAARYISVTEQTKAYDKRGRLKYTACEYELINDVGVEAPRVTRKGEVVTQGLGRERMWTSIRILKDFTIAELLAAASTEDKPIAKREAEDYVNYLLKAGYLRSSITSVKGKGPGLNGRFARYLLIPIRNSGPRAPMIQRIKQVYDPNLDRVVWPKPGDVHD